MGKKGENRWNGDLEIMQATSSNNSVHRDKGFKGFDMKEKEVFEKKNSTVPFYKLFSFADTADILLMILGSVGAVANGAALPISTILFGRIVQSFTGAEQTHDVTSRVSKVCFLNAFDLQYFSFCYVIDLSYSSFFFFSISSFCSFIYLPFSLLF